MLSLRPITLPLSKLSYFPLSPNPFVVTLSVSLICKNKNKNKKAHLRWVFVMQWIFVLHDYFRNFFLIQLGLTFRIYCRIFNAIDRMIRIRTQQNNTYDFNRKGLLEMDGKKKHLRPVIPSHKTLSQ